MLHSLCFQAKNSHDCTRPWIWISLFLLFGNLPRSITGQPQNLALPYRKSYCSSFLVILLITVIYFPLMPIFSSFRTHMCLSIYTQRYISITFPLIISEVFTIFSNLIVFLERHPSFAPQILEGALRWTFFGLSHSEAPFLAHPTTPAKSFNITN